MLDIRSDHSFEGLSAYLGPQEASIVRIAFLPDSDLEAKRAVITISLPADEPNEPHFTDWPISASLKKHYTYVPKLEKGKLSTSRSFRVPAGGIFVSILPWGSTTRGELKAAVGRVFAVVIEENAERFVEIE